VAVGLAIALACTLAYVVVRSELRSQIDTQLRGQTAVANRLSSRILRERADGVGARGSLPSLGSLQGGPIPFVQVLTEAGRRWAQGRDTAEYRLPVDATDRRIARDGGTALRDVRDGDVHLRMLTTGLRGGGGAVQIARELNSVDDVLARLRVILLLVALGGVAGAVVVGRLLTRRITAPLRDVAEAAAHIADTEDLTRRIPVRGGDEVGQLAARFNVMLDRLEASRAALTESVAAQRRLVADASHELRTPITSVRTNVEVLQGRPDLDPEARRQLISDVVEQTDDLAGLVGDIIELARGDERSARREDVRLDELVAEEVSRAERLWPALRFELAAEPVTVDATPDRLARAVRNLLDNAAKHSAPGDAVEVDVADGGMTVRDHGPGFEDDDLPRVFDRFYRGATSRSVPGTGLGLAIVRQVAEAHGGGVTAANAPDGGAVLCLMI
jgi:two-component system, OmpR family, sensor histidine kinase MprB